VAWTAPATATVGQLITAAFHNAQVRDNMLDLDSRVSGHTTTLTYFGYRVKVTNSVNVTIANNSMTVLSWDTEDGDPANMHAAGGSDLVAPVTGHYQFTFWLLWSNSSAAGTNRYGDVIRVGDSSVHGSDARPGATAYNPTNIGSGEVYLTAGDGLRCRAFQDAGAGLVIINRMFTMRYTGP
jgi:hypothetical protein